MYIFICALRTSYQIRYLVPNITWCLLMFIFPNIYQIEELCGECGVKATNSLVFYKGNEIVSNFNLCTTINLHGPNTHTEHFYPSYTSHGSEIILPGSKFDPREEKKNWIRIRPKKNINLHGPHIHTEHFYPSYQFLGSGIILPGSKFDPRKEINRSGSDLNNHQAHTQLHNISTLHIKGLDPG